MPTSLRPALLQLACLAACALGPSLPAQAAATSTSTRTLKEDFNADLPAWESRWFGKHSNAANYCAGSYCLVDGVPTDPSNTVRGIAGSGLALIGEGGWSSFPITITFDASFAAKLTSLKLDAAVYVESTFTAWDVDGNLLFSQVLKVDHYKDIPTSQYETLRVKSKNGIGGFSFSGPAGGNTVIDNVIVKTAKP